MASTRNLKKRIAVSTPLAVLATLFITANYASRVFAGVTGFDIGDLLVDVFHYFDNSTKHQALLKEYCEFCDQEYRRILKFGATRWLSKEVCNNPQYLSLRS